MCMVKYVAGMIAVDTALFACRIRKHRTTQMSPFFMVYGQDPKLPGDPLRPLITADEPQDDPQAHVSGLHSMNGDLIQVLGALIVYVHSSTRPMVITTWYDPTATRARWRQLADAANIVISVLVEGDQDFREGYLS
ncbi:hypothetical protein O0I10_001799 [Lichtheimia ornata]|uniref:Uncharacterized protein n=1 Tax=Lichtheimia ornata TaxID=688661 RepID=A0AAD7Y260_9FUNG|nr:uncharacterized protein O0I10_001799 [Lichtheimia ornata]KAJ8662108.1 hypothetical protein O0I10_001799 [Lichtheimia ornata]